MPKTGSPFYTKGKSDADHLALHNLLSRLNPSTSEACNRMGVALSEAGGTLEMMVRFVDKYLAAEPKVVLQKVGLQALAEHMNKDAAKQLRDAACVLNKHSAAGEKPQMSLQEAVGVWVQYFGEDCKEKAAQGGAGSFKKTKTIGEIDGCESRMPEQKHWPTD